MLSVMWPFDSSPPLYYKWSVVTMYLSGTVMEIWPLKDNGVTTFTFKSHLTSSVTWPFNSRLVTSYGWSIVTICLSCTVMKIWSLKCWTNARTHARMDAQVILYSVQCYALHWTDKNNKLSLYMVFHKKDPFLFFFIIHSNDDQFTQNLYQF